MARWLGWSRKRAIAVERTKRLARAHYSTGWPSHAARRRARQAGATFNARTAQMGATERVPAPSQASRRRNYQDHCEFSACYCSERPITIIITIIMMIIIIIMAIIGPLSSSWLSFWPLAFGPIESTDKGQGEANPIVLLPLVRALLLAGSSSELIGSAQENGGGGGRACRWCKLPSSSSSLPLTIWKSGCSEPASRE